MPPVSDGSPTGTPVSTLDGLRLKTGDPTNPAFIDLPARSVTVFVGPNNSGKSLLLREIAHQVLNRVPQAPTCEYSATSR